MLSYLISSCTRRGLLAALWAQGRQGSVRELATLAGVSYAGAYQELHAMERAGLARSTHVGAALVFCANRAHPQGKLLDALLRTPPVPTPVPDGDDDDQVRGWLRALGAPLVGTPASRDALPSVEQALAAGAALARTDAVVARALPVPVWQQRDCFDDDTLLLEARRAGQKQAMGFFLDLTGALARDRSLSRRSHPFRDRRVKATRDFFASASSPRARALAARKTPAVAKRWRYRMNMSLDSFQTLFDKFTDA